MTSDTPLEQERQTIVSWILSLEGTYREPVVGRVLRDILATVEGRELDPPEKYPPRTGLVASSDTQGNSDKPISLSHQPTISNEETP